MLTYYRLLTLVAVLLLTALGCSDDSDENDCRGVDDDGDGLIFKCGEEPPVYDSGTSGSGGSGGSNKDAGRPTKDAGDGDDAGSDDDAGN